jgi:hypothetical protein
MKTDVLEPAIFDMGQQPGNPIYERLAADETYIGILIRLRDHVLAATEPDLQPAFLC